MRLIFTIFITLLCVLSAPATFGESSDRPGSKDYPGISRMPGFFIQDYRDSQFDSYEFKVTENGVDKKVPVEGHLYSFRYDRDQDAQPLSDLQIIRNFQNAVRSVGGDLLRDVGRQDRETTLRFVKQGREVWVAISTRAHGDVYHMNIVEKQAMQQAVTIDPNAMAKDANAMAHDLGDTGRVAIYGIYFDTGKSELKPESDPALTEIAKLLNQNPAMKVYIVGHTDMVANLALNMKLSQARAQAVVKALVSKYGIANTRLIAFGNGPYAPVASNKTEEGRAKNRRVELVEIATQ